MKNKFFIATLALLSATSLSFGMKKMEKYEMVPANNLIRNYLPSTPESEKILPELVQTPKQATNNKIVSQFLLRKDGILEACNIQPIDEKSPLLIIRELYGQKSSYFMNREIGNKKSKDFDQKNRDFCKKSRDIFLLVLTLQYAHTRQAI